MASKTKKKLRKIRRRLVELENFTANHLIHDHGYKEIDVSLVGLAMVPDNVKLIPAEDDTLAEAGA